MSNKPKLNYIQVGRTIECGHCHPEKYGEGLKELERLFPNYKCDCVCHDLSLPEEPKEEFNADKFLEDAEGVGKILREREEPKEESTEIEEVIKSLGELKLKIPTKDGKRTIEEVEFIDALSPVNQLIIEDFLKQSLLNREKEIRKDEVERIIKKLEEHIS